MVYFVRHALPGELVEITDVEYQKSFAFAEVAHVVEPHPGRIEPRCPVAVPKGCGGCALQHATDELQLALKSDIVKETFRRFAKYDREILVQRVEPRWHWRTRMQYHVDDEGRVGMRQWRGHDVIPLPPAGCAIAAPSAQPEAQPQGPRSVSAVGRQWQIPQGGFWQVHPQAPEILTSAVMDMLAPQTGEIAWDLYCGVGLFAGPLSDAGCDVYGTDGNKLAITSARRNVPSGHFEAGRIDLVAGRWPDPDVVVCDPPRSGLDRSIVKLLCARKPRAIAYVSCHPASLAGKVGRFEEAGYELVEVLAYDLFPQTPHVECVAHLRLR
ncbi:arylamine N-acetyltransferase, pineal gland isozyme NAT-10-like [Platysternon megacephalum]|uniref:tRNA (uracil(54)-C(5))-methyltransferase n=1 Tax=Platysternon megacephalum TaxID=55544 RepID=A0A4D9DE02_9SAUR|nr:arylamine N-acetyltransferase, pineal gland isozyme NAT-10-like [Platysternon megacephalum]